MITMLEDPTFVFMWLGFLMLMSVGTALFFLWAIRSQQFSQQDRARYLALQSDIPVEVEADPEYSEPLQAELLQADVTSSGLFAEPGGAEPGGAHSGEAVQSAGEGAARETTSDYFPTPSGDRS